MTTIWRSSTLSRVTRKALLFQKNVEIQNKRFVSLLEYWLRANSPDWSPFRLASPGRCAVRPDSAQSPVVRCLGLPAKENVAVSHAKRTSAVGWREGKRTTHNCDDSVLRRVPRQTPQRCAPHEGSNKNTRWRHSFVRKGFSASEVFLTRRCVAENNGLYLLWK